MDTANLAAPFPLRAAPLPRTFTIRRATSTKGGETARRLLLALAGPANTAPSWRPKNPSRHRPSPSSPEQPD